MTNPLHGCALEFHILQSFPVTCLNRDDVGAPKSAIVGGVPRARVSSQCWKRQVRLALHGLDVKIGIRTRNLKQLLHAACKEKGASEEKATACAAPIAAALAKDNTLLFISKTEISRLADYAKENGFTLPLDKKGKKKNDAQPDEEETTGGSLPKTEVTKITKILKEYPNNRAADGLDIALFGRMVAQEPSVNIVAAAAFSHAISTHKSTNEVEFFTALDDFSPDRDDAGSAHMGTLEYNSATYYRYISLDLGQLWENLGGEDIEKSVGAFINALYIAVPAARQNTQSGACLWDWARVLLRKGPRMQVSFDEPVRAKGGWLAPSIEALKSTLDEHKRACGSLYGERASFTFGKGEMGIDELRSGVQSALAQLLATQGQA